MKWLCWSLNANDEDRNRDGDFYSNRGSGGRQHVGQISRDSDGRFVLVDSAESTASSDDGGFLSRPGFRNVASWRRPLVGYPSDVSLTSTNAASPSHHPMLHGTMIRQIQTPVQHHQHPHQQRTTPFRASSPTSSVLPALTPIMSPAYFSDLSSVRQSIERENLTRVHEQYSQELPSLHVIHQEQHRRRRYVPRHVRSAPDLFMETSPESRSSSSGFGSKNTSSQQNSSGLSDWRIAYRVPPLPPPPPLWLQYTSAFPSPTQSELSQRPSVDDHYEFDVYPISPTPTEMSPTLRVKYDNIEARVQAMKEEFHAFRARQARRIRSQLESAC